MDVRHLDRRGGPGAGLYRAGGECGVCGDLGVGCGVRRLLHRDRGQRCRVLFRLPHVPGAAGREARRYTTAVFGGKYNSLWELDDKTGQVIRRPGDKEILNKEWRRLQAVGGRYTDAELMAAVKGKPGWYPDYRNHGVMTWWDGDQWTDHTA